MDNMKQGQTSIGGNEDKAALLTITLITIGATILVWPTDNIPLLDDWTYAWSVEHLLTTGELRVLDWSAHYPLAQIIWGALFAHVMGFSFFTLRVSTLVAAWLGLLALYLIFRQIGMKSFISVLGTLALFFNPVMFVLCYTFMTDIPFLSLMNMAILCYILWIRRSSSIYLGLGSIFTTAAFLVRQIGSALAFVPLLYLLLSRIIDDGNRKLSFAQTAWLFVPFLGITLTFWWIRNVHGETSIYLEKSAVLSYLFSTSGWVYFHALVYMLIHVAFILWPFILGNIWNRSRVWLPWALGIVALLLGLHLWHSGAMLKLLTQPEIFSLQELGSSRFLIAPGDASGSPQRPNWIRWVLLAFSGLSAAALIAILLEKLRRLRCWVTHASAVLAFNTLLQFFLIGALWLYHDRYFLPLLPGFIVLAARGVRPTKVMWAIMMAGVGMFAVLSVLGTIDNFRFNRTVSLAYDWLRDQGVPPADIDGGYVLNGWWLYAHPENLPPGARPETDVPFVTSRANLTYKIANVPTPSYEVVQVFTWQAFWAASNSIYVLRNTDVPSE
jgi:Dolichyl-phosphate-mannose-protein mannosyltransferase